MNISMDKPQIVLHCNKSVNYTLYDCKWIPNTAKFICLGSHAKGTGALQIYELNHGEIELVQECDKPKSFKCSTFGASPSKQKQHLSTGGFEGQLEIWDIERPKDALYSVKAHDEIINCIDAVGGLGIGEGAPEIVTGSRDGSVKIWDPRQNNDPVASIQPENGDNKRDCWAVAFGNAHTSDERCVCAGYDNGDIQMFDLRSMSIRWSDNVKNGICGIEFDRKDINMNKMAVTCLESNLHVYDLRTQHPKSGFAKLTEKAHKSTVWSAKHLPQNRDIFMSLGGNGSMNLWKYCYPEKRSEPDSEGVSKGRAGHLDLHQNVTLSTQPICAFDWSPDKCGLGVCVAFDQNIRVVIVTKLNQI